MRNCLYLGLVLLMVVALTNVLQAQPNQQEERLRKLEEICKQQEQQIQKLQGRLGMLQDEESYKKYTENIVKSYLKEPVAEEDEAGITAGYEDGNGFFIRSADNKFKLTLSGYAQAGLGIFEQDSGDNNSFYLNGMYTIFDISILEKWRAYISVNYASNSFADQFQNGNSYSVAIVDAFVEYKLMPEVNFVVGKTLVPFSIAGQYNETQGISIWSEPFINTWTRGRDLGFMVHGTIADRVEYKFGIFNGDWGQMNNDDMFMFAGQLRFFFCKKSTAPNSFFHIGFLVSHDGNGYADFMSPWGDYIDPDDYSYEHWNAAIDMGTRVDFDFENGSNLRLEGEFIYSYFERAYPAAPLDGVGFWLGYAYRHCFNKKVEGSGLLNTFTFSYNDLDDRHGPSDVQGQNALVYTFGLGYAFNKHVWFAFNWSIMDLDVRVHGPGLEHAFFFQFTTVW